MARHRKSPRQTKPSRLPDPSRAPVTNGLLLRAAWKATTDFWRRDGFAQSAGLAFYALFSVIPLLFVVVSAAGFALDDETAARAALDRQIAAATPWFQDFLTRQVDSLANEAPRLGIISLIGLVWTSGGFFGALQEALHAPWRDERRPFPVWRWFVPWLFGPVLSALLVLVLLGAQLWRLVVGLVASAGNPDALLDGMIGEALRAALNFWPELSSWLAVACLIFGLYWLLLPRRNAPLTTFGLCLALSAANKGLTWLTGAILTHAPTYAAVYGSLAAAVLFLVWLQYNMTLLVWGARFFRQLELLRKANALEASEGMAARKPG